jgi:hypothetical protein
MSKEKDGKVPPVTFPGDTRSEREKWQGKLAESRSADTNDRMRDDLAARWKLQQDAGRMRVGKRLDKKDSMTALRRLAEAKASKKMSKTSKIGKMLDKKEMSNAPRKPFMAKMKKSK